MATKLASLFGSSSTAVVGATAGAAVVVAAAVGVTVWRSGDTEEVSVAPEPVVEAPVEQDTPAAVAAAPEANVETTPDTPAMTPPRFDVVRVDAEGAAVIAGFVMTDADVTLILDGAPIEVTRADGGGNFVSLVSLSPSEAPRVLSLSAALDGGVVIDGEETVIIAPFGAIEEGTPPDPPPTVAVAEPGINATSPEPSVASDTDAAPAQGVDVALADTTPDPEPTADATPAPVPESDVATAEDDAPAPEPAEPAETDVAVAEPEAPVVAEDVAAADPETPAAEPEAPTVMIASAEGIRVVQGGAPVAQTEIQIDAISYDVTGEVTVAGRGPTDASVRISLNEQTINMGEIGPGGAWSLDLPDVDPGTYTLRVEQIASDGSVTSDIVTPFLREDPERIAANPMLVDPGASVITVQPDFTLWGIAQANFGDGVLYVQIFEENRDRIRDPDMIFPGQIFRLPDLPRMGATTDDG